MRRAKLDKIDRKILRDLQANGRVTNVDLAKNAGISAPPCLRRVRALEDNGFIKGYHAKLDSVSLGYNVKVYAQVKLASQAEAELSKFEAQVKAWPMVRECHMLAGEVDFILKIVARDWDHYQSFLTNHLTSFPSVTTVKSSMIIRSGKEEPGVPIEAD